MIELNNIYQADCLAFMEQKMEANSINLLYTDVPYNMGSEYVINRSTGHYEFKGKGNDFMNQWEAMAGVWWDKWFANAYRIIKPGGYLITHNIDRQSDMWSYYARRNNFYPTQKLYWLFIDSFPKGADIALMLDNKLKVEREIIGQAKGAQAETTGRFGSWGKKENKDQSMTHHNYLKGKMSIYDKTVATSEIAKKYDGYKYGIAPYKQVLEEILVFWKQPKNNVPTEIIEFERQLRNKVPTSIHPSIMNIKDTRVKASKSNNERWTPQLLVDTRLVASVVKKFGHEDSYRIMETIVKIPYDDIEDNWNYVKKATIEEKEWGLDDFEVKDFKRKNTSGMGAKDPKWMPVKRKNTHPSPKPLALCKWVLNLFKIPNPEEMVVYDPFAGQGSIPLAAKQLGMKWIGTEYSKEFYELAKAKLTYIEKDKQESLF